jgi:hypothetical protein
MRGSDRAIFVVIAVAGLIAAFYFLLLAPKREEAADLEAQVTALQAEVTAAEQSAAAGQIAKKDFSENYRELIKLGKAAPIDADTPSLLTQLEGLSTRAGVQFRSISLGGGSGAGATAAPVADPAATEASAALLPIGATVGPAGLPVMGYELEFAGGFFEIAEFFGGVDSMVTADGDRTTVDGRLMTIDGFTLTTGSGGFPELTASVQATTYLTPADQGITAGATPSGPPTETPAAATPPADPAASPAAAAVMSN